MDNKNWGLLDWWTRNWPTDVLCHSNKAGYFVAWGQVNADKLFQCTFHQNFASLQVPAHFYFYFFKWLIHSVIIYAKWKPNSTIQFRNTVFSWVQSHCIITACKKLPRCLLLSSYPHISQYSQGLLRVLHRTLNLQIYRLPPFAFILKLRLEFEKLNTVWPAFLTFFLPLWGQCPFTK